MSASSAPARPLVVVLFTTEYREGGKQFRFAAENAGRRGWQGVWRDERSRLVGRAAGEPNDERSRGRAANRFHPSRLIGALARPRPGFPSILAPSW